MCINYFKLYRWDNTWVYDLYCAYNISLSLKSFQNNDLKGFKYNKMLSFLRLSVQIITNMKMFIR